MGIKINLAEEFTRAADALLIGNLPVASESLARLEPAITSSSFDSEAMTAYRRFRAIAHRASRRDRLLLSIYSRAGVIPSWQV